MLAGCTFGPVIYYEETITNAAQLSVMAANSSRAVFFKRLWQNGFPYATPDSMPGTVAHACLLAYLLRRVAFLQSWRKAASHY